MLQSKEAMYIYLQIKRRPTDIHSDYTIYIIIYAYVYVYIINANYSDLDSQ